MIFIVPSWRNRMIDALHEMKQKINQPKLGGWIVRPTPSPWHPVSSRWYIRHVQMWSKDSCVLQESGDDVAVYRFFRVHHLRCHPTFLFLRFQAKSCENPTSFSSRSLSLSDGILFDMCFCSQRNGPGFAGHVTWFICIPWFILYMFFCANTSALFTQLFAAVIGAKGTQVKYTALTLTFSHSCSTAQPHHDTSWRRISIEVSGALGFFCTGPDSLELKGCYGTPLSWSHLVSLSTQKTCMTWKIHTNHPSTLAHSSALSAWFGWAQDSNDLQVRMKLFVKSTSSKLQENNQSKQRIKRHAVPWFG